MMKKLLAFISFASILFLFCRSIAQEAAGNENGVSDKIIWRQKYSVVKQPEENSMKTIAAASYNMMGYMLQWKGDVEEEPKNH